MAFAVTYTHSFNYLVDEFSGKSLPGLRLSLTLHGTDFPKADIRAYLDTGAEFSLFDGALLVSTLGMDLMAGPETGLSAASGVALAARIHRLELFHPDLGRFALDAAISTVPIRRNLLGRDFFRHLQMGFREFHHTFLINAAP